MHANGAGCRSTTRDDPMRASAGSNRSPSCRDPPLPNSPVIAGLCHGEEDNRADSGTSGGAAEPVSGGTGTAENDADAPAPYLRPRERGSSAVGAARAAADIAPDDRRKPHRANDAPLTAIGFPIRDAHRDTQ